MKTLSGKILFSFILSLLFYSSCTTSNDQNRKKATEVMDSSFESTATDTARSRWVKSLEWPAWVSSNLSGAKVKPMNDEKARMWFRWVIPLPKLIQLKGSLTLPSTGVSLRLRSGSTEIEQLARDEIERLITEKTGISQLNGPFQILIGVLDEQGKIDDVPVPGAGKLRGLKNHDQAYVIAPLSTGGIAVAALTERGVYYGVKTLQQLMEPELETANITLPILSVLDWPDLTERGQWTHSEKNAINDIQYMADHKMSLIEVSTKKRFDENGKGILNVNIEGMQKARKHAVQWIPIIIHLNYLGQMTGIDKFYPDLKGQGPHARSSGDSSLVVPCASQPQLIPLLADFLMSAADKKATEVNIWLSELEGMQCECDKCKGKSQHALEAVACVEAWKILRKEFPQMGLRILTSQGSYDANDQILAAVQGTDVRIVYYSGSNMGRIPGYAPSTYTSSQYPMIYPLMADYAKQGHWLGCYPIITAFWWIASPWSCPQFMRFRMTEFADRGLASVSAYVPFDTRFFDFNFTALAEWSWNAHGRTEREFAAAWATRRRLTDPGKVAEWAEMLGSVSWNIYGSNVPSKEFLRQATTMITKHQQPILGEGIFLHFPTLVDINDDLTVCKKALRLAEHVADKAMIAETRTIQGYLKMIKYIYLIGDLLAGDKDLNKRQIRSLQDIFSQLQNADLEIKNGLSDWIAAANPGYDVKENNNPAIIISQIISDIAVSVKPLGIKVTP